MSEKEDHGDGDGVSNTDTIKLTDNISLSDDSDSDEPNAPFDPEVEDLSSSSSDGEPQNCSSSPRGPSFMLQGGSSSFSNRSQSIFDSLESAAKLTSSRLGEDNVIDGAFARPAPPPLPAGGKKMGDKCGAFVSKPPQKSPSSGVPDYLAHPERWTRYSLEDVPETSDSSNSQVAQEYIQGLQQQRRGRWALDGQDGPFIPTFNQDQSSSTEHKILFSKPSRTARDGVPEVDKVTEAKLLKKEMGPFLLEDTEEEDKDSCHHLGDKDKRKRKWGQEEQKESDCDGQREQLPSVGFISNRKVNRKNFRKTSEKDDD